MKLSFTTAVVLCSILPFVASLRNPTTSLPPEFQSALNFTSYVTSLFAVGTQNYKCNDTDNTWVLDEPEALLYPVGSNPFSKKERPRNVGYHYFLPAPGVNGGRATWELKLWPQQVTTKIVISKKDPNPANINVLLTTLTDYKGPPKAAFSRVGFVVRADTRLGTAQNPCKAGEKTKQPYSAVYHFYTKVNLTAPDTTHLFDFDD
ncbi:hypothetical protein BJ742DRAFT_735288 [Cladochytrium replicatum]|nr:hypothetical protein BJ742DRAFT_735288 [Cladochytrium replicatum]